MSITDILFYLGLAIAFVAFLPRLFNDLLPEQTESSVLAVLGSGGHTMEMLRLLSLVDRTCCPETAYLYSDDHSELKAREFENARNDADDKATFKRLLRPRKVGQSYISSVFTTMLSFLHMGPLIAGIRPCLVMVNGPALCVPVVLWTRFFNILSVWDAKIVFVESVCRVQTPSLTFRILYKFGLAHTYFVHWPELLEKMPKARYVGRLV